MWRRLTALCPLPTAQIWKNCEARVYRFDDSDDGHEDCDGHEGDGMATRPAVDGSAGVKDVEDRALLHRLSAEDEFEVLGGSHAPIVDSH